MKIDTAVEKINDNFDHPIETKKDFVGALGYGIVLVGVLYVLTYLYQTFNETIYFTIDVVISVTNMIFVETFEIFEFLYTYNQLGRGIVFVIIGYIMIKSWKKYKSFQK